MKTSILIFLIALTINSCQKKTDTSLLIIDSKAQIVQTEKEFEKMAAEKSIAEAFTYFADDSAVINRGDHVIIGKTLINKHYSGWKFKDVSLKWSPDFVNVAASCDLGYTYGKYTFSYTDSTGTRVENKGYFHTVWKKQKDGNWKYVWD